MNLMAHRTTQTCRWVSKPRLLPSAARWARRSYAFQASTPHVYEVFDQRTKRLQKERAGHNAEGGRVSDYLKDEVAMRVCERLLDIKRHYPRVLDFGANSCNIARALTRENPDPNPHVPISEPIARKIGHLLAVDSSPTMLYRDADLEFNNQINMTREVLPSEETIPYDSDSFDLVLSSLSMHWINNLPAVLAQINNILKPDCAFIGAMFGGDTLYELRTSLQLAEQERRGGISPHVSPLADVRDIGGLLQKANFKMLTVDVDDIIVSYPNIFALMQDLQAMGEGNAIRGREVGPIQRDVLLAAEAIYRELHGNEDGTLPATFRTIHMIGWKESDTQAQPKPRGSGEISLKDILENK
ncbi:putative NADH dehydrogenase [ubiquinone] 1 alpha subcomplex assembly factor 5 [Rosellinia necatrix]|uniref:Putative NADH dehydrogenase [ubiquinone] 1 alpha subcomplex assembly factor 5 n=1 Tax=Rosellinia necatrix TaxID=77044 RepID=A0A1W2TC75_ROSNE|nr:putative NADH dehydrogenase [ubiquinone] 1 alpha subcomplex assembly factor 5 [Rosellinia necatrix]